MTPRELIKKQAEAVTGFNKLTAAEHLEAAAKLLRAEAGQESRQSVAAFKAEIKNKKERSISKYADGLRKMKEQQIADAFAGSDWVKVLTSPEGVETYRRKGLSNHLEIRIDGDRFCVVNEGKQGAYNRYTGLGAFIAQEKKNRG